MPSAGCSELLHMRMVCMNLQCNTTFLDVFGGWLSFGSVSSRYTEKKSWIICEAWFSWFSDMKVLLLDFAASKEAGYFVTHWELRSKVWLNVTVGVGLEVSDLHCCNQVSFPQAAEEGNLSVTSGCWARPPRTLINPSVTIAALPDRNGEAH